MYETLQTFLCPDCEVVWTRYPTCMRVQGPSYPNQRAVVVSDLPRAYCPDHQTTSRGEVKRMPRNDGNTPPKGAPTPQTPKGGKGGSGSGDHPRPRP